jgi:hypothetical protein
MNYLALKGRNTNTAQFHFALSGLNNLVFAVYPGLRPGLSHLALAGQFIDKRQFK